MAIIMIDEIDVVEEEMLLHAKDFPSNYVNFAHPDDYKVTAEPIIKEFICHHELGRHYRLHFRVSYKMAANRFFSLSFVLDTGAPKFFYFSDAAIKLLQEHNLIQINETDGVSYVEIFGKKVPFEETPDSHRPANIMGLRMLLRLKLQLSESTFTFGQEFPYLDSEEAIEGYPSSTSNNKRSRTG